MTAMHDISSHDVLDYVKEMTNENYGGRLTGTAGYDSSAAWTVSLLRSWGYQPAGDKGTWYQKFANPYTLVRPGTELSLHLPQSGGGTVTKDYAWETEFFQGSTSDSGRVTAEADPVAAQAEVAQQVVAQARERPRPHAVRLALEPRGPGKLPDALPDSVGVAPGPVFGCEALLEDHDRRAAERLDQRETVPVEAETRAALQHRVARIAILRDPHGALHHAEMAAGRIAQPQQFTGVHRQPALLPRSGIHRASLTHEFQACKRSREVRLPAACGVNLADTAGEGQTEKLHLMYAC